MQSNITPLPFVCIRDAFTITRFVISASPEQSPIPTPSPPFSATEWSEAAEYNIQKGTYLLTTRSRCIKVLQQFALQAQHTYSGIRLQFKFRHIILYI